VAAFARSLLAGSYVVYDGDPLRDLTLPAFLDKFIQRKPKVRFLGGRGACCWLLLLWLGEGVVSCSASDTLFVLKETATPS
jgi:hypothetical protein